MADTARVRIEVVDPGGHGLGLAIGLRELGHRVRYRCDPERPSPDGTRYRSEVVARVFGSDAGDVADAGDDADLLVLVDVFADWLHALESGFESDGQNVAGYPKRLETCCRLASAADRVAVVDMADRAAPREIAFGAMPHVTRFAREVDPGSEPGWQPFPFLYNLAVLWLEHCVAEEQWLLPEPRGAAWDWAFCGTIDHQRYGQRRQIALRLIAERYPQLRGAVLGQRSFREVVGVLQHVRFGLDLPGVGELCFRLHECLAFGTPVWQPLATRLSLPSGLDPVVFREPGAAPLPDVATVRSVYRDHYSPRAAARWLLDRMAAGADQYPISQATNIAPAASK